MSPGNWPGSWRSCCSPSAAAWHAAGSRALGCFWQAVLGLRWFRDRTGADALARDHGISRATAYRYLDEVILVLAAQAPELAEALERARDQGVLARDPRRKWYSLRPVQGARPSASRAG